MEAGQVYCLHCERFVNTKWVQSGSSGVTYVLIILAALCALPAVVGESVGGLTVLSVFFGAAAAVYSAWRRPKRYQVCATCGSAYLVKDIVPTYRRAA